MNKLNAVVINEENCVTITIPLASLEALTNLTSDECLDAIQDLYVKIIADIGGVQ